jgi:hypothetical protein
MRVYILEQDHHRYRGVAPADYDDWDMLYKYTPRPLAQTWVPLGVIDTGTWKGYSGRRLPLGDLLSWVGSIPIFGRRTVDELQDLLAANGEILPLTSDVGELFAFHVTKASPALDRENTVCTLWEPGGDILSIDRYSFYPERIDSPIFVLAENRALHVLVTDEFVMRVQEAGLTGFKFRLVWDSEAEVTPAQGEEPDAAASPALPATPEAAMIEWLAHPLEFGAPPVQIEEIHRENSKWPWVEGETEIVFFRYQAADGFVGIGLTGPITWSFMAEGMAEFDIADLKRLFAGWYIAFGIVQSDDYSPEDAEAERQRLADQLAREDPHFIGITEYLRINEMFVVSYRTQRDGREVEVARTYDDEGVSEWVYELNSPYMRVPIHYYVLGHIFFDL